MFIVSALENPKEAICLLFVAIQLNMDFDLSITQESGVQLRNSLLTDIRNSISPFFVLKVKSYFLSNYSTI